MKTCTNARAIRQILCAIDKVSHCMNIPGFSVDVEITTENGVVYEVTFSSGVATEFPKITDNCLFTEDATISLSYISKIVVESSAVAQTRFMEKLTCEIYRIMKGVGCCSDAGDAVACLQKFINCNKLDIVSVNYNGGMEQITPVAAVTDVEHINVVGSARITTQPVTVSSDIRLNKTPITVAGPVAISNQEMIVGVSVESERVVTGLDQTPVQVSPPITITPMEVVTEVTTNPLVSQVVTEVTSTPATGNTVESVTKNTVATGFDTFTSVENVLGGITAEGNTSTTAFSNTPITVAGPGVKTGQLQIIIPSNTFGQGIPENAVTLNVIVGGDINSQVSLGTAVTLQALTAETSLLTGITGVPTSTNLSIPNALTTAQFVEDVTLSDSAVVGEVTSVNRDGKVIMNVGVEDINNPTVGAAVSAVGTVAPVEEPITVVDEVTHMNLRRLITSDNQTVLSDATVLSTPVSVLKNADIQTTQQSVVKEIDSETINVLAPVNENIEGNVVCAGNGIMTVENDNGDVSLYNICDINAVKTCE